MKTYSLTLIVFFFAFGSYAQDPLIIRENSTTYTDGDAQISNLPNHTYGFSIRPYDATFQTGTWNWERDFGYRADLRNWYAEGGFTVSRGSLAVGTWEPSYQIEVVGSGGVIPVDGIDFHKVAYFQNNYRGVAVLQSSNNSEMAIAAGYVNNRLSFATRYNYGSGNENRVHMTIMPEGNIGIGTKSPEAKLEVQGSENNYSTEHFIVSDKFGNKDLVVRGDGSVEIGYDVDAPSGFKLAVDGKAIMEEVVVKLSENWPDYVFEKDYPLTPLQDLETYLKVNKHLPGIPNAQTVEEEGVKLGEMNAKLLEKVEELTLYIIKQEKRLNQQEELIDELYRQLKIKNITNEN